VGGFQNKSAQEKTQGHLATVGLETCGNSFRRKKRRTRRGKNEKKNKNLLNKKRKNNDSGGGWEFKKTAKKVRSGVLWRGRKEINKEVGYQK